MDNNTFADEELDAFLQGRRFKRVISRIYDYYRKTYAIKQVEVEVLFYLGKYPDASASEICRVLGLNKGQVSQALDDLCRRGYLIASVVPEDRRYVRYAFTETGLPLMEKGIELHRSFREQVLDGISEEEYKTLRRLIRQINDNLEKLENA